MGDFEIFLNCFAKSPRLIVLNIDWVQFVLKNCEIPSSVLGLYDKQYCFTSDVLYKKYKGLVYTPSDLLARICKVNLSNAKKFGLICFPRICFRGLIYCDQEPLWLLNVIEDVCCFLGVHIFRPSSRKLVFYTEEYGNMPDPPWVYRSLQVSGNFEIQWNLY